MRMCRLYLKAFGPFTERVLDFGMDARGLVLIHGPNEAGKSSALRAMTDLRFGIPLHSTDNFVHAHPDMRVGGEFIDREGKRYSLMRRKGRNGTLYFADFGQEGDTLDTPVPLDVERLLTGALRRDEFESMFGLDHHRLREGGQALLRGEGDVGAALFEASAGIRSIPQILEHLDSTARRFFMPGARARNGRINETIRAYEEHHAEYRQALVRPSHWAEVFKTHHKAADDVDVLETRRRELNAKLLLIKELRAVAPLIGTLAQASKLIDELKSVPLLSQTAATDRAAAEAGLADAKHNAERASAEAARHEQRLSELTPDNTILRLGISIRRLAASAETIDQFAKDLVDARVDVENETVRVSDLAASIDASRQTTEVAALAPARVERVQIEQLLYAVESANQALREHYATGQQSQNDEEQSFFEVLPSPESRVALRIAQAEVARRDSDIKRLTSLPGEIKAERRSVTKALEQAGLADEAVFRRVRPMLDAQIDASMRQENADSTRRHELGKRINQMSDALRDELVKRAVLLAQGNVPTWDDVAKARLCREAGWTLVKKTYVFGECPSIDTYTAGKPLPDAYEEAVVQADRVVDELASDSERAAQLQSSNRAIETLQRDQRELELQLQALELEATKRADTWSDNLAAANLPAFPPAALREWQMLLPKVQTAVENLQSSLDEFERLETIADALKCNLHAAVIGTGLATPTDDTQLDTLIATAFDIDTEIVRREAANNRAAGKRLERERQQERRAAREAELIRELQAAREGLVPALEKLLLPADATVEVARARMVEFEDLVAARERLGDASVKEERAKGSLAFMEDAARAIWQSLGDQEPPALRLYIERLSGRLDAAESIQAEYLLSLQALTAAQNSLQEHEETRQRHQQILIDLCKAADVESPNQLPEVETDSQRKRDALLEVDRSRMQLAQASRQSVEELQSLLANYDAARMEAEEMAFTEELKHLESTLETARQREEQARHALESIDGSDTAVAAREAMEQAAAGIRANMLPWIRSRVAHGLLTEALKRFRERAQGPMLTAASGYFSRMTRGELVRLLSDDTGREPVLIAERGNGARIRVEDMSEGTRDQLYLALRLAALNLRRTASLDLPVVLDDVLMTSDDLRSGAILEALADFARENQVLILTHHRHMVDLAQRHVSAEDLTIVSL